MSISVAITKREIKTIGRALAQHYNFVMLDPAVHIKVLLVAQLRLAQGKRVNAKIVKGYLDV